MNIALYIRLSKEDNLVGDSKSIISQRMYLKNYVKKFTYNNVYEYIDDGYSGTNFNRPAFKKMIKDIELKKIDTIITKDSSRLGRNISWVTFYIEEFFPTKKVRYIAIDDNYDSYEINSLESEMLTFKSLFNDYYCKDISKKIKSSLKVKKVEGKFTGWKAPYGYIRSKKDYHILEIDYEVADNIKKIFELAYKNNTPSSIAKYLNDHYILSPATYINLKKSKWTTKTIKDILTNPTYIGNMCQGKRKKINYKIKKTINVPQNEWIIKEDTHPALIDKKIFLKVQEKLQKYKNIRSNIINDNYLINLMYCKECNAKIGLNYKKNYNYCVCNNYKKNYFDKRCTPHTFNYNKLEKMIIDEINNDIMTEYISVKKTAIQEYVSKKKELEKNILVLEQDFFNNKNLFQNNFINKEKYKINNYNLVKEIKRMNNELHDVMCNIKNGINQNNKIKELLNNKKIFMEIIDKIYISETGEIEVNLKYSYH